MLYSNAEIKQKIDDVCQREKYGGFCYSVQIEDNSKESLQFVLCSPKCIFNGLIAAIEKELNVDLLGIFPSSRGAEMHFIRANSCPTKLEKLVFQEQKYQDEITRLELENRDLADKLLIAEHLIDDLTQ